MLDRLFDFILQCLDYLKFVAIFQPYEAGVLVRLGKYVKNLDPGWHWIIPMGVDIVHREHTVPRTHSLPDQSATTQDGKQIGFTAVITYQVRDVKKCLLEVEDAEHAIKDACAGTICHVLGACTWAEIVLGEDAFERVSAACRKRGFKYGLQVDSVQFSTMSLVKTLRLLGR